MEATNYQIINYSEKAIALVGDTKAIKEQLKAIGIALSVSVEEGSAYELPIRLAGIAMALLSLIVIRRRKK